MTIIVKIDRETGEVLAGPDNYTPQTGDYVRITTPRGAVMEHEYTELPAPQPRPRVLTKTDFNKHGWSKIGMAAFQKILEDVRKSTGTTDADFEARAAVEQYDSATTFAKAEVEAIGVKIKNAGHMTQQQFEAITGNNWPVG
jgi:hypothetical protein